MKLVITDELIEKHVCQLLSCGMITIESIRYQGKSTLTNQIRSYKARLSFEINKLEWIERSNIQKPSERNSKLDNWLIFRRAILEVACTELILQRE